MRKYRDKSLAIDEIYDAGEILKADKTIRDVSPIRVTGRAEVAARRVTFHLRIEGYLILPCSRTLVDVKYPIDVETTEIFLIEGTEYDGEEEVHPVHGEVIDLGPIIREILLLEVPMQVFSDEANPQGGAPQSGTGWAVISEENQEKKIDPRLAPLAKLLEENKPQE